MPENAMPPDPRKSKQYRIGDYARYMGVTPDFLKHYEQHNLIASTPKANGYRYYAFEQSSVLLECMRLRGYGVPLRSMDAMLHEDDAQTAMDKLNERVAALERQIRLEQAIISEHRRQAAWFDRMKIVKEDWLVQDSGEMLFLPHTSQQSFLQDDRIYDILGDWLSLMPMVKSCMRIPAGAPSAAPGGHAWGLLVPASVAATFDLPINGAVLRLPPRKTYYHHFCGAAWKELDPLSAQKDGMVYRSMSRLGVAPCGDIYMALHMQTDIGQDMKYYGYFAVPID